MEYLTLEDGWVPFSIKYKFEDVMTEHIKSILIENICEQIQQLSELKIEHGSIKNDNIMFNYKNGDIRIIDFESSKIFKNKKTSELNTRNNFSCTSS